MSTKAQYRSGILSYYEGDTFETDLAVAPLRFKDDFHGKAFDTTNIWTARDTGAATEALVSSGANGILALALDATSEVQVAGVDWGDSRTLVLNQGLVFEARIKLSVLPTGSVVACVGLCGNYNAAVNTVAESIWFRADGSGALTVETDDTVNETSQVATGVTLTTADWAVLRIDCSDPTSVRFYINGNQVAASTTFNMNQVPALALQPVARIGKEGAATSVGTLHVDYIAVWQKRS